MKKVFILSATPRKNGNSELLAQQFAKGAEESGNIVTKVNVRDIELKFCLGCLYCSSHGACVQKDGMNALYDEFSSSDVIVFATPISYYEMSGQMKTFLDRLNPLYYRENKFKEVYLLATSADTEERAMDGAVKGLEGWIECFDGVELKGVIRATGVEKAGEVKDTPAFAAAYETGKTV